MNDMKKYLAELLGTFVLVFMGTGSAVVAGKYIAFLGISLAFGISVPLATAPEHAPRVLQARRW